MSERWRDTYDQWKTRAPDDDDAYVCDACGGWLRWTPMHGWYCEACDERDDPTTANWEDHNNAFQRL